PFAAVVARADHLHDAEAGPDLVAALEQRPQVGGPGVGGDVVIVGGEAEEFVADAPARPQRREPGLLEPADHVQCELALGHCGVRVRKKNAPTGFRRPAGAGCEPLAKRPTVPSQGVTTVIRSPALSLLTPRDAISLPPQ